MKHNITLKQHSISHLPLLFFMFVLAICPVLGQNGQKQKLVLPKDYAMWHNMRFPIISGDGKWTSYLLDYQQVQDTLVIMDIDGKSKYEFSNAHGGQFAPCKSPKLFAFNNADKGVGVLDLIDGTTTWIKEAQYYQFSLDGKYLACYKLNAQNGYLKLFDIENNKTTIIEGVQSFEFNPFRKEVALITKKNTTTKVEILYLSEMRRATVVSNESSEFLYLKWNAKGDGLVFMENSVKSKRRLYYFEHKQTPLLKELYNIHLRKLGYVELSNEPLSFSDDGERVFFSTHNKNVKPKVEKLDTVKVQVWKGKDKLVYPRAELYEEFEIKDKMAVWWPNTGKIFQIGTKERPEAILTGDQKFALTYNPLDYEPQFKEAPPTDYYLTNLENGETKMFLKKMETEPRYVSMSPNGKFISYFKDLNWWIYDIHKNVHKDCTYTLEFPLTYKHAPSTAHTTPFGYMGWTNKSEFLIYDQFDIWKISPNDNLPKQLTSGRDEKRHYRKYYDLYTGFYPFGISKKNDGYNLSQNLILTTQDSLFNYGFVKRSATGKINTLIKATGNINGLRKAMFKDSYIFMKEKYNEPPSLNKLTDYKPELLAASNRQQADFKIGKTQLISYKNEEGEKSTCSSALSR